MRPYEAMVVLRPALEEAARETLLNRLTSVITDEGGELTHVDQWGKRRLAYVINDHIEGFYVVIKFQGSPGITTEMERIMRISDAVLRFLVVRDEAPTAVPATTEAEEAPAEADAAEAAEPVAADEGAAEEPVTDAAPAEEATEATEAPAAETAEAETTPDAAEADAETAEA